MDRLGVELSRRSEMPRLYADGTRFSVQPTLSLADHWSWWQASDDPNRRPLAGRS
jgi:hypothetical protein